MSSAPKPDFGVLLNLAFGAFKDALEAHLAAQGFDDVGPSFGYVLRLLDTAPCSLTDLAAQLGMTPPGALKVVDDMVAKGYVERRSDAHDGRVKRLHLATRGHAALAQARAFHALTERALAERLGVRRVAAAREVLEHLAAAASGPVPRAARPT